MSTPTPIEIVRAQWDWVRESHRSITAPPHTWDEFDAAFVFVLADAERFKALELALTDDKIFVSTPDPHDDDLWAPHDGTLAELADRLKGTQCSTTLQSYRSGLAFT